jgi:hypothetical protein
VSSCPAPTMDRTLRDRIRRVELPLIARKAPK